MSCASASISRPAANVNTVRRRDMTTPPSSDLLVFRAGARQDLAVLEFAGHEHAAGFAVAERPERHRDAHAGQQRASRPATAREEVGTHPFECKRLQLTRRVLYVQPDPDMREIGRAHV